MHNNFYLFYSECNPLFYYHNLYLFSLSSHNVCIELGAAPISSAVELVESAVRLGGEDNRAGEKKNEKIKRTKAVGAKREIEGKGRMTGLLAVTFDDLDCKVNSNDNAGKKCWGFKSPLLCSPFSIILIETCNIGVVLKIPKFP